MSDAKLRYVRNMLAGFGAVSFLRVPRFSDQIFELYCYFRKIEEFADMGKIPQCQSRSPGIFKPHAKPGRPRSADYFRLIDPGGGEDRDLILNGKFEGISGIFHSPDIALTKSNENRIISIYECKNHSGSLSPGIYREFIGYCEETGLLVKANRRRISALTDTFPVVVPCIYTSATANQDHVEKVKKTYSFSVVDDL